MVLKDLRGKTGKFPNFFISIGDSFLSGAVAYWLSIRTHNTGVVSSNPARVTIKTLLKRKATGKQPHKIHFHSKNSRALTLVSASLKIEHGNSFFISSLH